MDGYLTSRLYYIASKDWIGGWGREEVSVWDREESPYFILLAEP